MLTHRELAEAISGHWFSETYDQLAADIVWIVPGQLALRGPEAVKAACEDTASALQATTVTTLRFLVVAGEETVAVDSVTRYAGPDGAVSVVSSSDFYEFAGAEVRGITSYAVELKADELGPDAYVGAR